MSGEHDGDHLTIARLNGLDAGQAVAALAKCGGSAAWASRMAASRPFADETDALSHATEIWWDLTASDWEEALRAFRPGLPARPELNEVASRYEERFGHPFVPTDLSATLEEQRANCLERLDNDPLAELTASASAGAMVLNQRLRQLLGRQ